MTLLRLTAFLLIALAIPATASAADIATCTVDWPTFLARHDLTWNRLPEKFGEGAFTGNGLMGALVTGGADHRAIHFEIGRTDVTFHGNRLPIGDLVLTPRGKPQSMTMRLDLWNAEAVGTMTTDAGTVWFRTFTHADQMVQVIEYKTTGEEACTFEWQPGLAVNPRAYFQLPTTQKANYASVMKADDKNPPAEQSMDGATHVCVQPLVDGEFATAWQDAAFDDKTHAIVLSVGNGHGAQSLATSAVTRAIGSKFDLLVQSHRNWWHNYYPESFLSIPDTRMESFYWIQMYKLASATRSDRPVMDLMGPWFHTTPWPKIWWNLNIQLTYWSVLTSNRTELGEPLCKLLDDHADALNANAGEYGTDSAAIGRASSYDCDSKIGTELCNLPWALHNYWLQYRYTMDEPLLTKHLFPLLKRSMNFYIHLLKMGPDHHLHLTNGYSPEYPNQPTPDPDCNIDLSLLRWGCQTLLDTNDRCKLNDADAAKWKNVLDNLTPYPTDDTGLRISASVPFAQSHRHYSHLLMIYPLYLMNLDQPEHVPLIRKSVDHWLSLRGGQAGYTFTGAASIEAMLGNGDAAAADLNSLLDNKMSTGRVQPNTLYMETGPVIETPLSAAASLHDMLLSSWGDRIRVFPAAPTAWKDVSFYHLRTQGAFLVSAVRKDGKTRFVQIESLAGQPCKVHTDIDHPSISGATMKDLGDGVLQIDLAKGQSALLRSAEDSTTFSIEAVAPQPDRLNQYGVR